MVAQIAARGTWRFCEMVFETHPKVLKLVHFEMRRVFVPFRLLSSAHDLLVDR
jgi:hypothetical protein